MFLYVTIYFTIHCKSQLDGLITFILIISIIMNELIMLNYGCSWLGKEGGVDFFFFGKTHFTQVA